MLNSLPSKRLLFALFLVGGVGLALMTPRSPRSAQASGPACSTSSPTTAAYTATLCITSPTDGATLSGTPTVAFSLSFMGTSPKVSRISTTLNSQYLLTYFSTAPYQFTLPTNHFVDGTYTLQATAKMNDGFTTSPVQVSVTFLNGIISPPVNTNTFVPSIGTAPQPGQPFVAAAVGDGAGGESNETNVVNLLSSWNPNLFLYLGDVYDEGTWSEFYNYYGPSNFFGKFASITDPTVGNHEYLTGSASGYTFYWNNVPNYYSFNAGGWHWISLNSNAQFVPTSTGSPQYQWLQNDLAANSKACTVVYYHHPVYNVGPEGSATQMNAIWSLLAQNGVSVVLNGHDHDYQRWVPLDGSGNPSPNGITEFVVGGGGHSLQQFITNDSRLAVGYDATSSTIVYGALRLELSGGNLAYKYINTSGSTLDSGTINCAKNPPPSPSPSPSPPATPSPTPQPTPIVGDSNYKIYLPLVIR